MSKPKLTEQDIAQHWRIFNKARQLFDPAALARICSLNEEAFVEYGKKFALPNRPDRYFFYRNINAPILAVAHLDSVQKDRRCDVFTFQNGAKIVFSPVLDDRLGAYVILDLLSKLGVKTDVLLTIGEETGKSTAEHFQTSRQYNWMFSFDRREDDVVMYRYRTNNLETMLESIGADPGYGSFSDICELEHLGCQGMNWGVGYEDYHSDRAFAYLNTTFHQIARFVRFYLRFSNVHLAHEKKHHSYIDTSYDWQGPNWRSNSYMERSRHRHDGTMRAGYEDSASNATDVTLCKDCGHSIHTHNRTGKRGCVKTLYKTKKTKGGSDVITSSYLCRCNEFVADPAEIADETPLLPQ